MIYDIRPISQKWFSDSTPLNYTKASATLGTGDNGTLTIKYNGITTTTTIAVVIATGANKAMAVALADGEITITLGTGADSNVAAAKNTVLLISAEISKLSGFIGSYSGTGGDSLSEATTEDVTFTDGHLGTPCQESGICLYDDNYHYVCETPNNSVYNTGWKKFALVDL
jgi:hypothetical protein